MHHLEAKEVQGRNQVNIGFSDTPVTGLSRDIEPMGYLDTDPEEQAGWETMVNLVGLRSIYGIVKNDP